MVDLKLDCFLKGINQTSNCPAWNFQKLEMDPYFGGFSIGGRDYCSSTSLRMFAFWKLWGGRSSTLRVCRRAWKTALKCCERRRTCCGYLRIAMSKYVEEHLRKAKTADLRQVAKGEQFQALGLPKSEDGMMKVRVKAKKVTWIALSCRILTLTVAKQCEIHTCSLWERHRIQAISEDMYLKDSKTEILEGPWFLPFC